MPTGRRLRVLIGLVALASLAACGSDSAAPTPSPGLEGALQRGMAGRWPTATPEDQGLSRDVLNELEDRIDAGEFGSISSLLVFRGGVLTYERYAPGWTPDELHRMYSVTKSVSSLLVGIARGEGLLPDLSRPVLEFFPEYSSFANPSPRKAEITLEHVLHMRAGFEWDEVTTSYLNEENSTVALVASNDWIKHVLDLPISATPGTRFTYNSGVSMLMSGVLRNAGAGAAPGVAAGSLPAVEAYASARLFEPLGIRDWLWAEGPDGVSNTGWGLWLRPRDMAAIGELVRLGGVWEGERVVSQAWLDASLKPGSKFTDGGGYGYQWWLGPEGSGLTTDTRSPAAWGWGGQFIVLLPSVDVMIVTTAENYQGGGFNPTVLAEFGYRAAGVPAP